MSPWEWLVWVIVLLVTFLALVITYAIMYGIVTHVRDARNDRNNTNGEMEIQDDGQ